MVKCVKKLKKLNLLLNKQNFVIIFPPNNGTMSLRGHFGVKSGSFRGEKKASMSIIDRGTDIPFTRRFSYGPFGTDFSAA